MDLVVRAPRLPSAGDTVIGADLVRVPGGKGANQAVAAAQAGAPHFGLVSTLIVNRGEALALGGGEVKSAAQTLRLLGPARVIVTLGAEGLLLATDDSVEYVAAQPVAVVDATAAGDAFAAAFATAYLEGQPALAAARFANVAAGLATTRLGAQTSLPRRAE